MVDAEAQLKAQPTPSSGTYLPSMARSQLDMGNRAVGWISHVGGSCAERLGGLPSWGKVLGCNTGRELRCQAWWATLTPARGADNVLGYAHSACNLYRSIAKRPVGGRRNPAFLPPSCLNDRR